MGSTAPRKTNKKPTIRLVVELWRRPAVKRSKTPPDEKLKKKPAAKRSKTPPDEKHKKKLAEKHSKTLPGEKHKKNPSEEDQFKKTVDTGRPNSNHNPLPSSQEIHNTLSRVHRSATRAMEPFNALPVMLSGTQPV